MPDRTLNQFRRILSTAWILVVTFCRFMASLVGLLAEGAQVPDANDTTNHAARGGVLNYRTGQLDDGTDATGWYEKD